MIEEDEILLNRFRKHSVDRDKQVFTVVKNSFKAVLQAPNKIEEHYTLTAVKLVFKIIYRRLENYVKSVGLPFEILEDFPLKGRLESLRGKP